MSTPFNTQIYSNIISSNLAISMKKYYNLPFSNVNIHENIIAVLVNKRIILNYSFNSN